MFGLPERIGTLIPTEGIYVGKYKPTDAHDRSLNRIFKVYAAPTDITEGGRNLILSRDAAHKCIKNMNLCGHGGSDLTSENKILHAAKHTPERLSFWHTPTLTVLTENLFKNRNKMPKGSEFVTESDIFGAHIYLSCTLTLEDDGRRFDFVKGEKMPFSIAKFMGKGSVRPVRMVLVK